MDPDGTHPRSADPGATVVEALGAAARTADDALGRAIDETARREAIRAARRALKSVRALAPLCRGRAAADGGPPDGTADGIVEFAGKANQLLGPLRDRDALARSVQRISDRFADGESRRLVRNVLLAALVFSAGERRDDAGFARMAIERARRSVRAAREACAALGAEAVHPGEVAEFLSRLHRTGRDELRAALATSDLARLHECRKRASVLALSLEPFGDALPEVLRRLRGRARRLAAALGDDRDLAILDVEMRAARARLGGAPLLRAVDAELRLARLEAGARVEDAARAYLRIDRRRTSDALGQLLDD